ncbi:aconitate hydratase [Tardisphaera miroshnichenkoae]
MSIDSSLASSTVISLETPDGNVRAYSAARFLGDGISAYPYAIRLLIENALRNGADPQSLEYLIHWRQSVGKPISVWPSRVILQDATGVPVLVDLAALRESVKEKGGDPLAVNPVIPVDLVIDHSVKVDYFGSWDAALVNHALEMKRNEERYSFLKWAQGAFKNLAVVPPGNGIIHQVNIEHLSNVIELRGESLQGVAFPELVLGTDSHTSMASALGYLAWGVGGLEAEEAMLGQPYPTTVPEVVGVRLMGELKGWSSATDLALFVTQELRKAGVVGSVVEFFGPAVRQLPVADRAAISNMAPEYGATTALFPIDDQTLSYLRLTGKGEDHVKLVDAYAKQTGLFMGSYPEPQYSKVIELDLSRVEPSISGPSRPDQRMSLSAVTSLFSASTGGGELKDGFVALAAITSCTNTSNPWLILGAAMLAREAVKRGLSVKPWVKTSFAPGSPAALRYLEKAGLMPYLEALKFHVTGMGCTVCIGNSGPLLPQAEDAIRKGVKGVSVISGNRNFPYRIHPLISSNFLASPPLVVAYALAGSVSVDLTSEPIGNDPNGRPVYLKEIMPSRKEVSAAVSRYLSSEDYIQAYASITQGNQSWEALKASSSALYAWQPTSTFIRRPPLFSGSGRPSLEGARALLVLGDDVNTDMISPAGEISPDCAAGKYLIAQGVKPHELGTYLSRRGNHEVMARGTFANPALENALAKGRKGPWTSHLPDGELMGVYEAAMKYKAEGVPLVIIAGERYGSGSSRDWAAKGPALLGIKAVMAVSFERIHRSNLISVGILPVEIGREDKSKLTGDELYSIRFPQGVKPRCEVTVEARSGENSMAFTGRARIDTPSELERYLAGGVLPLILKRYAKNP